MQLQYINNNLQNTTGVFKMYIVVFYQIEICFFINASKLNSFCILLLKFIMVSVYVQVLIKLIFKLGFYINK